MSVLASVALDRLRAGLAIIPVETNGSKRPLVAWAEYQGRLPAEDELASWFGQWPDAGQAVIAGSVSGNLEIIDFDDPALFEPWQRLVEEAGGHDLLRRLTYQTTPRKGCHVIYRCEAPVDGNAKLARSLGEDGRPRVQIETRGQGGYALVAPSPNYTIIGRPLEDIATIAADERAMLLSAARALNSHVDPARVVTGTTHAGGVPGDRPGDEFNARATWAEVLEPHGWTTAGRRGDVAFWRRPGKTDIGHSATENFGNSGLLYVFSSNGHPLESDRAYDKFAAFAVLNFAGDYGAAAKELRVKGYGSPPQKEQRKPLPSEPPATPIKTQAASEIAAVPVSWLWPGRIARGFLNLLAGPAGVGKSTTLYDLAARVSREGGRVLIATAEDHLAAVVRPRLEAARADLANVHVVTDEMTLPADIGRLETRARELEAALVTCDPLVAFLGADIDSHKDASVRQALRPLAAMAEGLTAAVVAVVHTNKSPSDDPLFRISGSGGFTAAARHVLLACADPEDEEGTRRVLAVVKSNLAPFPAPLAYTIEQTTIPDPDGMAIPTSRIAWGEEIPGLDPRSLLRPPDSPEERGKLAEAIEFLRESGLTEEARPTEDLVRDARKLDIAERTLRRARRDLGILSWKDGFSGAWNWGPKPTPDLANADLAKASVGQLANSVRPAETHTRGADLAKGPHTQAMGARRGRFRCLGCGREGAWTYCDDCTAARAPR